MDGYAVFDVETTGLSPAHHHRVVEIGIVLLNPTGGVQKEWASLINPHRDIGASEIHGVRASDVAHAPRFEEVAAEIAHLLNKRIPIAHNLPFDARFLEAEFTRMGVQTPQHAWSAGICTMRWSGARLPIGTPRSLHACCTAAGISYTDAHAALPDARAAAQLFTHLLRRDLTPTAMSAGPELPHWPDLGPSTCPPFTRQEVPQSGDHFLARIIDRIPGHVDNDVLESYLGVLDRALLDRHLSVLESQELVETALHLGLSRSDVVAGHHRYLRELFRAAWADGVVTPEERQDLEQVTMLLGLSVDDLNEAAHHVLHEIQTTASSPSRPSSLASPRLVLSRGDHVVFTGTSDRSRDEWHTLAQEWGLVPRSGVTKTTRAVVAADPDTQSSKAKKARNYGIPVITESAFDAQFRRTP